MSLILVSDQNLKSATPDARRPDRESGIQLGRAVSSNRQVFSFLQFHMSSPILFPIHSTSTIIHAHEDGKKTVLFYEDQ